MNFPARQPENKPKSQEEAISAAERRRRQDLLDAGTAEVPLALSWGERLLPLLFAAMETCWVYAILLGLASVNFFQSSDTLIPVWAPFVLILGSYWLLHYMERRAASGSIPVSNEVGGAIKRVPTKRRAGSEAHSVSLEDEGTGKRGVMPGTWMFITFAGVVTLFLIWLHLYAQTTFVLDPSWLLALLNDILLFNFHTFQVLCIVGLTVYFCWRGIRIARRVVAVSSDWR